MIKVLVSFFCNKIKKVENMNTFLFAFALMQCGLCANAQSMANLFLKPHLANQQDPATSMSCFSDYIVKSNEVGEAYGRDYKQCLLDARAGRQATDTGMIDKRLAIEEGSRSICTRLSACDDLDTTLDIFRCHAKIGANNTKDAYNISGYASEYAIELQEKYHIMDLHYEQCCKAAERSYVEATGANYRNLQSCLDGRDKTSSSTTTTTTNVLTTNGAAVPRTTAEAASMPSATELKTSAETFNTTTSDASELIGATLLPGTEEFARLSRFFK